MTQFACFNSEGLGNFSCHVLFLYYIEE